MRARWAAIVSGAFLMVGAGASAQNPVTLNGFQLDGVTPLVQYQASQFQLRITLETATAADPDAAQNALLTDDLEAMIAAQEIPDEEAETRCTPARMALLAIAGSSESSDWQTSQDGALSVWARQSDDPSSGTVRSPEGLDPAATTLTAPIVNRPASARPEAARRPDAARAIQRNEPAAAATRSVPAPRFSAAVGRPNEPAAAATRSVPVPRITASAAPNRAAQVNVPFRTSRSQPGPSIGGAPRVNTMANAADIVARVNSQVNRALSAIPGPAGGFPR